MIKNKEELLNEIRTLIGDNTDDSALSIVENISDTIENYETQLSDTTDWKKKYEENDATWREKYRDRFFNYEVSDDDNEPEVEDKPKAYTYDSLFKEI